MALYEDIVSGHFVRIAFSEPLFEPTQAKAAPVPGYLYFDYLPKSAPNLIQSVNSRKRKRSPISIHHDIKTPAVEIQSHASVKRHYAAYLKNLKKYSYLPAEVLADPCVQFAIYFFTPEFSNMNCVSQYGGRYDMLFIVAACLKLGIDCHPLSNGAGYVSLLLPQLDIHFTDSYKMLQQPLKQFDQRFNLRPSKQHFPYRFLTQATLNYYGKQPEFDFYHSYNDSVKDIENKKQFVDQMKTTPFDMRQILLNYCISDVVVMLLAMCCFSQQCQDLQTKLRTVFKTAEEPNTLGMFLPFCLPTLRTLGSLG